MRKIVITYTAGHRARLNLCFVEETRDNDGRLICKEHECVRLDPDDPVCDYAMSWIRDGHIPIAPTSPHNPW